MTRLTAYRTPPQMEQKAAKEAREAGYRAYVPTEPKTSRSGARRVPTARGYVFADGKPHDAKHIKSAVGTLPKQAIGSLYIRSSKTQRRHDLAVGQKVMIERGHKVLIPAEVVGVLRGGWYDVAIDMLGKRCVLKMHEDKIAKTGATTDD